jgi:hypothetical protein
MVRTPDREYRKPVGLLVWGKDIHDIKRKSTALQPKFNVHGQRLDVAHAKYHSDIVYLNGRYKQYEIPIVPVHKNTARKHKG